MKQLWAPWRMDYIKSDKTDGCIFCILPSSNDDDKNYILFKGIHSFVIMNIFPYNCAHLMVSPYSHIGCITKTNESEKNNAPHLAESETLFRVENWSGDLRVSTQEGPEFSHWLGQTEAEILTR